VFRNVAFRSAKVRPFAERKATMDAPLHLCRADQVEAERVFT
jgi:hypothetical protein